MSDEGTPIAYSALTKGVPVLSRSGQRIGTLERVVADPGEDIFLGIVVATRAGARYVTREQVERMTTRQVRCTLEAEEAAQLPAAPAKEPVDRGDRRPLWRRLLAPWTTPDFVVIVRCDSGGLFQTVWVPFVSVKALRFGPWRFQWCPVHRRAERVEPVDPATLSRAELAEAARYPAAPIP